jgi:hypothetical protein
MFVVAVAVAVPPGPPGPAMKVWQARPPVPPWPPCAEAVFDRSRGVVVAAFAEPPAPPGFPHEPGAPFGPAALTLPATVGVAPAASKASGSADVTKSRCAARRKYLVMAFSCSSGSVFLRTV